MKDYQITSDCVNEVSFADSTNRAGQCLEAALEYGRHFIAVVPLHTPDPTTMGCSCGRPKCRDQGKHPRTWHGCKNAKRGKAAIGNWWRRWPDANVGVATGGSSRLVILDIDPRNGGDKALADLEARLGPLPLTPTVRTGGGGLHYYLRLPPPQPSLKSHDLASGVQVLADGKLAVGVTSLHKTGLRYAWLEGRGLDDVPIADIPKAWLDAMMVTVKGGKRAKEPRQVSEMVKPRVGFVADEGTRHRFLQVAA